MDNTTAKFERIDVELVLRDVMDIVCRHLELGDLRNVSKVCKSWYLAASREIAKIGPECILLPYSFCDFIATKNSRFHISQVAHTIPNLTILFTTQMSSKEKSSSSYDILNMYRVKYGIHQGKVIVGAAKECRIDENEVNSITNTYSEESLNGILGLLIPLHRQLKIHVVRSSSEIYSCNTQSKADKIIEKLAPEREKVKYTMIIFTNSKQDKGFTKCVLDTIKNKFQQNTYSLWGGAFTDLHMAPIAECKDISVESSRTDFFAISISGTNVDSWSTLIDCKCTKDIVVQRLVEFKSKIHLRRYNIGLLYGPSFKSYLDGIYPDSQELMRDVKIVFPDIKFIGIFNTKSVIGVDSYIDDRSQELSRDMAVSVMVLSYG